MATNPLLRRILKWLIAALVFGNMTAVVFLTTNNNFTFAVQTYDGPSASAEAAVAAVVDPSRRVPLSPSHLRRRRLPAPAFPPPLPTRNATQDFLVEMGSRRTMVSNACRKREEMRRYEIAANMTYRELYLNRGEQLLWCPVYKASSTNWLTHFVKLANVSKVSGIQGRKEVT
jgi:hypothetical protein